jgi:hypothetical protein
MADSSMSVAGLFAARDAEAARKRREAEEAEEKKKAEIKAFAERVMAYQITDEDREGALAKIRHAFLNGDREVMLAHFPSEICEDRGRRINNHLEGWQDTLPGAFRQVHTWWEETLKPGGFGFAARVISYPNGMPGEIGLFVTWPEHLG